MTAFAVDAGTSKLTQLNVQATRGAGPCHLTLDKTGRFLAVANYGGGNYLAAPGRFRWPAAGGSERPCGTTRRGEIPESPRSHGRVRRRQQLSDHRRQRAESDAGVHLRRQLGQGALNNTPSVTLPPGSGPRHYAFHPSGKWLFTINEQGATITTFAWNAKTGSLTAMAACRRGRRRCTTGSTAEIAMHPSGRFVYGFNRGHDSIAVFGVGGDGALTLVEDELTRGRTPRNFSLDPSGRWLIAANQRTDTLAVFSIDQTTGALTPAGELTSVPSPVSILFVN